MQIPNSFYRSKCCGLEKKFSLKPSFHSSLPTMSWQTTLSLEIFSQALSLIQDLIPFLDLSGVISDPRYAVSRILSTVFNKLPLQNILYSITPCSPRFSTSGSQTNLPAEQTTTSANVCLLPAPSRCEKRMVWVASFLPGCFLRALEWKYTDETM